MSVSDISSFAKEGSYSTVDTSMCHSQRRDASRLRPRKQIHVDQNVAPLSFMIVLMPPYPQARYRRVQESIHHTGRRWELWQQFADENSRREDNHFYRYLLKNFSTSSGSRQRSLLSPSSISGIRPGFKFDLPAAAFLLTN
jgi:hypothetical protein